MTRQETIEKYAAAFLKGKSDEAIEKFNAKEDNLKYASIMQWRRRMKKIENTPKSTRDILETLHKVAALIDNAPHIPDSDISDINAELDKLHGVLASYHERQKAKQIDELEARSREIAMQLEQLRNS